MKFYRRLQPFKAISFDLDDTLYSNQPIMQATDQQMVRYFAQQLAKYGIETTRQVFDAKFWFKYRRQAIQAAPELKHDVGLLRLQSYLLGALDLGLTADEAQHFAQTSVDYFLQQRSNFTLPQKTHELLAFLAQQRPLVAITNGNVDTKRIDIARYFQLHFHASIDNKRKPDADMFTKTCRQLAIEPEQLLHVGDCGKNDVFGGVDVGCQTIWLNRYQVGKPLKVLPSVELDDIEQMRLLFN